MNSSAHTSVPEPLISQLAHEADLLDLIELFVHELPRRVEAMEAALHANDLSALAGIVHQLKGAAGSYGFPIITLAAKQLEDAAKSGAAPEQLASDMRRVAGLCARARAAPACAERGV
ncbi:MAG TPA: Hpt domain-containing protein [Phycisphaerae bacterium]|nr:Hpt domain-containing protein [Phycisphaerae bacterium]